MKILHITPSSNGYEEVTLLANRISRNNQMGLIEKNGERFITGGILIEDHPQVRKVLDATPIEDQYELARLFRVAPFECAYWDEKMGMVGRPFDELFNA